MKNLCVAFVALLLVSTAPVLAQSQTDTCHVYVVDVEAAQRLRDKLSVEDLVKKSKQEQEAILKSAGKTYEEFATKVGEEELTTRSYPFPKGKHVITASVFYTDESMGSTGGQDSMLLAISVAASATKDSLSAPDAAVAEITYNDSTDTARVKKNVILDGRLYVVGLECRCQKP